MKSKKLILRTMEIVLGLAKIEDIVDFDIRGMVRSSMEQMQEQMGDTFKMMLTVPYELKLALMKFCENAANLAEAEHGPHFSPKHFNDSLIKIMNGNPLNMMAMLNTNNVIKN